MVLTKVYVKYSVERISSKSSSPGGGTVGNGTKRYFQVKKAEESSRESENKFRDLVEKAIVGVYLVQDGVFKYVNSRFAEIHGYEMDELVDKKGPQDTVVPEDIPKLQENIARLLSGGTDVVRAQRFRITTKKGETRHAEVHSTHTLYRGKKALIGTLLDITEQKVTEEALTWKTAFLEALLGTSSDGILVIDSQGKTILQNQRTVDMWKIPQEMADRRDDEAQARHILSVVKDQSKFQQQALLLCSHPNEAIRDEVELFDGTVIERYSSLVVGKDGTPSDLIRQADGILYSAKQSGRDRVKSRRGCAKGKKTRRR